MFGEKRGRAKGREIEIIFFKTGNFSWGKIYCWIFLGNRGAIFGAMLGGLVSQLSLTLMGSEQQNTWKKAGTETQEM